MTDLDALRTEMDAADAALIELLAQRRGLSQQIQALRATTGSTGIQPSRERQIRNRYTDALGPAADEVARAVLVLCRGWAGDV